ncbi:MAG TPA: GspE/PulE family protein [Alicycliphilus sp.]|jgi:general secretion pathway protein E|nr:GspE/PulE family protein [Alicycliphilus sp.]
MNMAPETLDTELLARLRQHAGQADASLWTLLAEELRLSDARCRDWLGAALGMDVLDMEALHGLEPDFSVWSHAKAVASRSLVAKASDLRADMVCVTQNPFDLALQGRIEACLPGLPRWCLAHPDDLVAYFARIEDTVKAMDGAMPGVDGMRMASTTVGDLSLSSIAQDASPVVRFVHSTLFDALKAAASDVHLECAATGIVVKYRIDGVLNQVAQLPSVELAEQIISRIKVMSELDISERRVPQDGRFKLSVNAREIDFRVSIMPSLFGEDVVVRILDRRSLSDQAMGLRLDHLGFNSDILARVRQLAREPYGMLLVTGPTGSGKTTTLYAALAEIHTGQDKIITIEDPVEYQLPGILQIPVNEAKGLSFALGLRSILRHDPDKILVGEIRDADTAQIAVQSALTGHLVFTSVHANNAFDVLGRFAHMDIDLHSFVSALNGVLAQRLMRVVCPQCSTRIDPDAKILAAMGIDPAEAAGGRFVQGKGCGHCRGTGYKGRRAIGELLRLDDEMREMIIARAPMRSLKEAARARGTVLLRDVAVDAALQGLTTLEEVGRVTYSG